MKVVVTWIIGGTMSGYCAMGRPCIATTPSMTRMIDNTIATIGRLTKKRDMIYFALRIRGVCPVYRWCGAGIGLVRTAMPSRIA